MLGCAGGHWVLGTPYTQQRSMARALPKTIVHGVYKERIYQQIEPTRISIHVTVTTPAECATLIQHVFPEATAAEYSNAGHGWCNAASEAVGVIYDPEAQTCLFE
jgi:hypothetical protein